MDTAYFKKHVLPLKDQMYRHACWLLKNRTDAEDVVQEVFLNLWRQNAVATENLHAYCIRSVRNACIDHLRKNKGVHAELDKAQEQSVQQTPLCTAISRNDSMIMEQIVMALPEKQRQVLQLRNVEGYSLKEIAIMMEMSENALTVMLSRTRKKIHAQYLKIVEFGTT